jgi:hypothetical protein
VKAVRELTNKVDKIDRDIKEIKILTPYVKLFNLVDKIDRDIKEIKDKVLNNNKPPVSDPSTKGTWDEAYKVEKKYPKVKKIINRDW